MLTKISFDNYRCFEESSLTCKRNTIIVGKNNSGKSTVVEALRIIAYAVKRYKTVNYIEPPQELNLPRAYKGFIVPIHPLNIDLKTVVYQYGDQDGKLAIITAHFSNKTAIKVYCNPNFVFANILDSDDTLITSKAKARMVDIPSISIMPQIGLIRDQETKLNRETVISNLDTRLASRHFRNELLLYEGHSYSRFKKLAEKTWSGLRIQGLNYDCLENNPITLLVHDAGFSAEIGAMGSGLQMWLQIIWFISRSEGASTIILDEPDVYMHPEMQNEILHIIKRRFPQTIIATHSAEIISNVAPNDIVQVDKSTRIMKYASDSTAVQNIIDIIGSSQNIALLGLANSNKCLFVEGKDLSILEKIQNVLRPDDKVSIKAIPSVSLGGWSRFNEALGAARLFYEQTNGQFKAICILDRDFHPQELIKELMDKAEKSHLELIVWNKKEIENYIIVPSAIARIMKVPIHEQNHFSQLLESELDNMRKEIVGAYTNEYFAINKKQGPGNAWSCADNYVREHWIDLDSKLGMVNGKEALACVNRILKEKYHKSCSKKRLIEEIRADEVDQQMVSALSIILD